MSYLKSMALCLLLVIAGNIKAQKIRNKEGNPVLPRGTSILNIQYSYEGMTVGKSHTPEREFMDENIDRLNEKRPGKGADWAAGWRQDRTNKYEPQFRAAFEAASGIRLGDFPEAPYTLIFRTTHMEGGYNIRIARRSSFIDGEVQIVETAHPEKMLARFTLKDCKGRSYDGYDFAASLRLMEAYANAGEVVGRLVSGREQ